MSSKKPNIILEEDLRNEAGAKFCKAFLHDRGVPNDILDKMSAGPALDQFYHLVMNHRMSWRDAIRWCNEHKAEILMHDRRLNNERPTPTEGSD